MVSLKKIASSIFSGKFISTIKNYKQEVSSFYRPEFFEIWDSICCGISERQAAERAIEKAKKILDKE